MTPDLQAVLDEARRRMVRRCGVTFGAAHVWTVTIAELEGILGRLHDTTPATAPDHESASGGGSEEDA